MSELLHVSSEEFLRDKLDTAREGLRLIPELIAAGKIAEAEHEFGEFIRRSLEPEKFFRVPYSPFGNVCMLPGETEQQLFERLERGKIMSCNYLHDFGPSGILWEANPTPNKYAEWTWQLNRHPEFGILGHLYRETGNERIPELFIKLFRSWREQCQCDKDVSGILTLSWRTIEIGIRLTFGWQYAIHSFYRSPALTDHDLCEFFASMWENAWRLRHFHRPGGNWLFMEMAGLYHVGLLYPWLKDAAEWKEYALDKTVRETEAQLYPDGFHIELSTNYHGVLIHNVRVIVEITRAMGEQPPEELLKGLEKAYGLYAKIADPAMNIPDVNDGGRTGVSAVLSEALEYFPEREDFRFFATKRAEGRAPEEKDTVMPWSGVAVLRDDWTADSQWLYFDGGPFGLGHQHEDKLSLQLYAFGKELLRDTGNYAYDTSKMRAYVLSAYSHNTVTVDGAGQNRRDGYRWHDGDLEKPAGLNVALGDRQDVLLAEYDEGFGPDHIDVLHRRTVVKVKSAPLGLGTFYIVIDCLRSRDGRPHLYEADWQLEDVPVRIGAGAGSPQKSHELPQYSGRLLKGSRIEADYGEGVTLTVLSGENVTVRRGSIDPFMGWRVPNIPAPCLSFQAFGTEARIVTVLYPSDKGCPLTSISYDGAAESGPVEFMTAFGQWIFSEP